MLLSRKLFNEFFPNFKSINNLKLEEMLNSIGVEVESVFHFEKTNNLIVGEIIDVKKHEKSDKLNVCIVNVGDKENRTIICGASNVKVGLKVIVALEGSKMIDGREICEKNIMGIKSQGMICSYCELTNRIEFLPESEKDKIIELDNSATVGYKNPLTYIGLDDEILDLSIPSNRNELNGIIALGFDLISIYFPNVLLTYNFDFEKYKKTNINLYIDKNICKFFGVLKFKSFEHQKSSWKIKYYLMNSGIKPINLLVDITNLNMVITGNPSHCYDAKKISNQICVEINKQNESFVGLNSKSYTIDANTGIFVYSENKPISLAGIIGANQTSVSNETIDAVFEIGNFNNLMIRKLVEKINLKTEASNLFSKKIPLWITLKSFESLIELLEKSNAIFEGINYSSYHLIQNTIDFDVNKIKELLGIDLSETKVTKILKDIGFNIINKKIYVPIYREDIENIQDVVEEIVKKIDINNFLEKPIENTQINFDFNIVEDNKEFVENYFLNKGFCLVKTLNLTSKENNEKFNIFNTTKWVKIKNPISNEREYFRNNLIQQHLDVLSKNYGHKNEMFNIFEIQGLIYDDCWEQHLCVTFAKNLYENKINGQKLKNDLLLLKALLVDFEKYFGIKINFEKNDTDSQVILKNNSIKLMLNNELIGIASQISPLILKEYKIDENNPIFFIELKIEKMLSLKNNSKLIVKDQKTTHAIKKLLTATVNESYSFKDIFNIFKTFENDNIISNIQIESIYQKENNTSYTFSFEINENVLDKKNTDQINGIIEKIINKLEENNIVIKR